MDWETDGPKMWGPYAVTAGCAGLGVLLRVVSGPGAVGVAVLVPLLPAALIVLLFLAGRYVAGLDRGVEVGFVAGCLAALSGWIGAAGAGSWAVAGFLSVTVVGVCAGWLAYGPGKRVTGLAVFAGVAVAVLAATLLNPLGPGGLARWGIAWFAGTTAAAVPYWVHVRVRAANQPDEVDVAALTAALDKHAHCKPTQVEHSLNVGEEGRYSLRYRLSDGKTATTVQLAIPAIESELSLRPGAVMVEGSRHRRDEVTVSVTPVEPTTVTVMPDLPTSIVEPAPLGLHDNGDLMLARVYDKTGAKGGLFGGRKGSGKSRALWTLLKAWTRCRDVLFVFIDLSGGATSNPWLPCLHWPVTTAADGVRVLDALLDEATARAAILGEMGWESWQPSPAHPAIVVVIDEVQRLVGQDWEARTKLEQIVQVDRKSGISVICVCPNPVGTDGITPPIRENSGLRLCFASTGQAVKYVLEGTPTYAVSYVVAEFDQPGQVLGYGPGLAPVPGRAFDTDLAEATRAGKEHAQYRPDPSGLLTPVLRSAGRSAPAPDPGPGKPAADTEPDPLAMATDPGLADQLRRMAAGPGVLGHSWPDLPDLPPTGRMSTDQARGVVGSMVQQEGGASLAAMAAATGYSRQWVHNVVKAWQADGRVENDKRGRWEAVRQQVA